MEKSITYKDHIITTAILKAEIKQLYAIIYNLENENKNLKVYRKLYFDLLKDYNK